MYINIRYDGINRIVGDKVVNDVLSSHYLSDNEIDSIDLLSISSYKDYINNKKLSTLYIDKLQEIKNSAQKIADSLTDKYPKIEQDSWIDMSAEADNDGGPLLDSVTDGMSAEQRQEFIDTVKTKSVYFKLVRASLIRQRLIFSDQLESIKDDLEELENFEVNYTLPAL